MSEIVLSIQQVRHWTSKPASLVAGCSSTQEIYYLTDSTGMVQLPLGGWSLHPSASLRIRWTGRADRENMYEVEFNGRRVYTGLWTPKLLETVTESFFCEGDLWVLNYRLLKTVDE
jgi:hypothetical protein